MLTKRQLRTFYENEFFEFESNREYENDIFTISRLSVLGKILKRIGTKGAWLDVGCGFGLYINTFSDCNFYGVMDLSRNFLEKARENIPNDVLLCQGDAEGLPFKEKSFFGVTALELIEHTPNPSKVIGEICRISSCWVVLSFPTDYDWIYTRLRIFKNPYLDISEEDALKEHVGHISVPKLGYVKSVLKENGYNIQYIRGLYSILPPPFKLKFHYPAINPIFKFLYRICVRIDHYLGKFFPFRLIGLNTLIVAHRIPTSTLEVYPRRN